MGVGNSKDIENSSASGDADDAFSGSGKRKGRRSSKQLDLACPPSIEPIRLNYIAVPSYKKHPFTDYKFVKKIGTGAFSVVYKGASVLNEVHKVAVKEIRTDNLSKNQLVDLQNEMNILSQLRHPNIVKLMSVFMLPEKVFLVRFLVHFVAAIFSCLTK